MAIHSKQINIIGIKHGDETEKRKYNWPTIYKFYNCSHCSKEIPELSEYYILEIHYYGKGHVTLVACSESCYITLYFQQS